ncbi:MAG: rhodanese-like domain-containing protein [Bacteroidetes bacterium]|nr:rhodanese-like domain-containing protein [Bacteroidota bacterium]
MNTTLRPYIILLLFAAFMGCKQEGNLQKEGIQLVSPAEMQNLLQMENVQLIDVRTPVEYTDGHLPNAQNINFFDDDFEKQLEKLDKNQPICVYCKSGGRSSKAAKILREKGFKAVYNLDGGIIKWQKEGLEVEESESDGIPKGE